MSCDELTVNEPHADNLAKQSADSQCASLLPIVTATPVVWSTSDSVMFTLPVLATANFTLLNWQLLTEVCAFS